MHHGILLVCLVASGLVNFYLLWLNWRWSKFAAQLQQQRDKAQSTVLLLKYRTRYPDIVDTWEKAS